MTESTQPQWAGVDHRGRHTTGRLPRLARYPGPALVLHKFPDFCALLQMWSSGSSSQWLLALVMAAGLGEQAMGSAACRSAHVSIIRSSPLPLAAPPFITNHCPILYYHCLPEPVSLPRKGSLVPRLSDPIRRSSYVYLQPLWR